MFKRILIANRGEIAVRVARTCRRLGIETVAVYSEPDARGLHVKVADHSVALGGTTAVESYLDTAKVLAAAKDSGAEAVHPGYGFLSENSDFSEAVTEAGLKFVGPPPPAVRTMGDKITSKELARAASVPTIPGYEKPIEDASVAQRAADSIGYPVLLKPAAGGGGKGMRIVMAADELEGALTACRAEAKKGFGDDRVFLERYILKPRHIEIQVLADSHGNVVHLGERECSVQRRYQKVIEEAPSVVLDDALRQSMGEAAMSLARAADYENAGTVEFILDEDGSFYFLEMNTRLQVEHPVTELTKGLDLVEWQLKVAAGDALGFSQDDVQSQGWAIEARVCAEDPSRGFIPSTGPITRYEPPRGRTVRVDSGVEAGSFVSVYYDSMLAKVIAYGEDRETARHALVDALDGYYIEGPSTNIDYVNSILMHPAFIAGDLTTNFIQEHMGDPAALPSPAATDLDHMVLAAVLVYHNRHRLVIESLRHVVSKVGGIRGDERECDYVVKAGEDVFRISVAKLDTPNTWSVDIEGRHYDVVTPDFEFYRRRLRLEINGERKRFRLKYDGNFIAAAHSGIQRTVEVYSPREWALAEHMPESSDGSDARVVECPMPGLVVKVKVEPDATVHAGQVLLTLESMKMESGVASPRDGVIKKVCVKAGQAVEADEVLVEFADD